MLHVSAGFVSAALCQLTDVPNKLQSLHKAVTDWDGVGRRNEHEDATLSFLAEMSWCSHGLGLAEGIDLFAEESLHIRGQLQNSLRLLRAQEEWNTWTNESLNKSSSKFVSRPIIAKQFGVLEWAHFLGFHPASYLCQLLESTEISSVWADEREREPSVICILMILPPNCILKKSEINLNLWDLTSESNPKPGAVTQSVSLEFLQRK